MPHLLVQIIGQMLAVNTEKTAHQDSIYK